MYKQYQQIELLKDLNPIIKKGMTGVILEIWGADHFEIEFVKEDGSNFEFDGSSTFIVDSAMIRVKNGSGYLPRA